MVVARVVEAKAERGRGEEREISEIKGKEEGGESI